VLLAQLPQALLAQPSLPPGQQGPLAQPVSRQPAQHWPVAQQVQ
jgi:hypothetical protein